MGNHGLFDSIAVPRDDMGWLEDGIPLPADFVHRAHEDFRVLAG